MSGGWGRGGERVGGCTMVRCTTKERSGMTDACSSVNVSINTLADISVLRGELGGGGDTVSK